jgi:serine/threonine protein kinase
MAIDSAATLLRVLRDNFLLMPSQLKEISGHAVASSASPLPLAKALIQRGWLSVYQVNQVFQGEASDLVVGQYRILDRLGEGENCQVFKAWDTLRECFAALKILRPDRVANPEALARFRREIQVVSQLSHPNIVRAFDVEEIGERHYYAMEYVQGTDLAKLVGLSGSFAIGHAADYIRQAALGMQHAHERGLVHRDLKPGNLLLTDEDKVIKILDMGLARLPKGGQEEPVQELTQYGSMIGTSDYQAPEQARDPRSTDIRADVYSLGCTLYHLLAGQPPFPGKSIFEKVLKHQQAAPPNVCNIRPEVPSALASITQKMMAKQPADRHQAPEDVARALMPFCRAGTPLGSAAAV